METVDLSKTVIVSKEVVFYFLFFSSWTNCTKWKIKSINFLKNNFSLKILNFDFLKIDCPIDYLMLPSKIKYSFSLNIVDEDENHFDHVPSLLQRKDFIYQD